MTKLEEVARALYGADAKDQNTDVNWTRFRWTPNMRAYYFPRARAAIEALRRPNEAMERAGDETGCFVGSDEDVNYRGREAGAVFTAMIDAILSEGDGAKP